MYRAGSGKFQTRGKTYAKRASVGAAVGLGGTAYAFGSRRGRAALAVQNKYRRGFSVGALKKTAGFRRGVRRVTGRIASAFHGLRAARGFARMVR